MSLEQRVQALEQEVQLLKAQIQATLLDMQEQLLNTKYPTLRPDDAMKAASAAVEMPAPPPAPAQTGGAAVKRVVLTEPEPDEVVNVRQMSTGMVTPRNEPEEDVRVQPVTRAKSNGHRPMPAEEPRYSRQEWEDAEQQPSREPRYAEPQRNNRQEWDDEEQPPSREPRYAEPQRNSRQEWEPRDPQPSRDNRLAEVPRRNPSDWGIQTKAAPKPEIEDDHDWIELENWVSQKVEKLGITRTRELINIYTKQERFSRQERDLLLQFVSIYDGAPRTSNGAAPAPDVELTRPNIVPQTRAVVDEIRSELRQKRAALKQRNESYQLSDQQELVMRLIAGILSTGDDSSNNGRGNH